MMSMKKFLDVTEVDEYQIRILHGPKYRAYMLIYVGNFSHFIFQILHPCSMIYNYV